MKVFYLCLFVLVVYVDKTHSWAEWAQKKLLYSNLIKCNHATTANLDVKHIQVHFYDSQNNIYKNFPISKAASGIFKITKRENTRRKFIIFIGGFTSNMEKDTIKHVRDVFREIPNSYLIIIDHSQYTNDKDGKITSYERSVTYVYHIGKALGGMLSILSKKGIPARNMHCIGHSLGGQMLGYTGKEFQRITGKKIWRITALDPAGPCFSKYDEKYQVRKGVAEYVEVYHCNAGVLGSSRKLADIDFFLNEKGRYQPTCGSKKKPAWDVAKCSHKMCIHLFLETVDHPYRFLAQKCDTYEKFKDSMCTKNAMATAGYRNPGNATGVYYLSTKRRTTVFQNYRHR